LQLRNQGQAKALLFRQSNFVIRRGWYDPAMALNLRWVGEPDFDRVAETRLRCYAKSATDLESFKLRIREDTRSKPGDFLLAEDAGQAVGTATHISYTMRVRGSAIPCQGVAWVGAIKTMRRKGAPGSPGVASAVMREVVKHARDRGDVVSALMPFRASYYEHFGYGVVERRCDWTVPIAALPTGPFDSVRFYEPGDFQPRADCLTRVNRAGQCAIERSNEYWQLIESAPPEGFAVVDREGAGPVRSAMVLQHHVTDGRDIAHAADFFYQDAAAFGRQLHFLSSLKDQFSAVHLSLPADVPLNRLITESQIPHRPVNHPVSKCHPYTRMQVRILDHGKFLESLHLPSEARGSVHLAINECEGHQSRVKLEIEGGKIHCSPSAATAAFECPDRTWAAIATGDLKASDAIRFGLATGDGGALLDALATGPLPFTHERF
jgi:predicted acetyltransferase